MLLLAPTRFELEALLGSIPGLGPGCVPAPEWRHLRVGILGFGQVAAGISAARHFARENVRSAMLVGIAGAYDLTRAPLASVHTISTVHCHGIGAGEGSDHLSAQRMGFTQMPPELAERDLGESIPLAAAPWPLDALRSSELLSVCSASSSAEEVAVRRRFHPRALLEDMEGFAVAMAATTANVSLHIVRAVSNAAGDRDKQHWEVHAALSALRGALTPFFAQGLEDAPEHTL